VSGVGGSFELSVLAERSQPKNSVTVPATITTRIETRFTLEISLPCVPIFKEADIWLSVAPNLQYVINPNTDPPAAMLWLV